MAADEPLGLGALLSGRACELVGIEDQDDGGLRLYLTHRARGVYALVYDEDVKADARAKWRGGQRVLVPTPPPDCVFKEGRHAR